MNPFNDELNSTVWYNLDSPTSTIIYSTSYPTAASHLNTPKSFTDLRHRPPPTSATDLHRPAPPISTNLRHWTPSTPTDLHHRSPPTSATKLRHQPPTPTSTDLRHRPPPTSATDLHQPPPPTSTNLYLFHSKDVIGPLWRRLVSGRGAFWTHRGNSKFSNSSLGSCYARIAICLCLSDYSAKQQNACDSRMLVSSCSDILQSISHHTQTHSLQNFTLNFILIQCSVCQIYLVCKWRDSVLSKFGT